MFKCTCKRFVLLGIFVAWDVDNFGAVVLEVAVVVVDAFVVVVFELELKEKNVLKLYLFLFLYTLFVSNKAQKEKGFGT